MRILTITIILIHFYSSLQINDFYSDIFKNLRKKLDGNQQQYVLHPHPEISLWKNGVVKIYYDRSLNEDMIEYVQVSMRYFEENSCIRFENATKSDFLRENILMIKKIYGKTLCEADFYKQIIGLSPETCKHGSVLQNIMKILGFEKEQIRIDRNNYIDIIWDNIGKDDQKYFKIPSTSKIPHQNLPYDYTSIMHDSNDYKGLKNSETIRAKIPPADVETFNVKYFLGQQRKLSMIDFAKINKAYNCPYYTIPKSIRDHMRKFESMYSNLEPYLDEDLLPEDRLIPDFRKHNKYLITKSKETTGLVSDGVEVFRKAIIPSSVNQVLQPKFVEEFKKKYNVSIMDIYMNLLKETLEKHLPKMSASDFDMKPKGLKDVSRYKEDISDDQYILRFPSGANWPPRKSNRRLTG